MLTKDLYRFQSALFVVLQTQNKGETPMLSNRRQWVIPIFLWLRPDLLRNSKAQSLKEKELNKYANKIS